jgi:NAD(P)-dependent dehydrogenase (short-subunit alcohol dehydrogenase family)
MSKTWFITGATRGMGTEFAKAAVAAGHNVVATGRKVEVLNEALGTAENLLTLSLDVNDAETIEAAVTATRERFGRLDVLINNAANFYAGYFEEQTPEEIQKQFRTTLFGTMNVTRAVLPVMRAQRSGHVITISSTAGLVGYEFATAYSAAKFAIDGWMEGLQAEVEPFGITTTIVNPGFFRTELLSNESTSYAEASIEDYAERNASQRTFWTSQNGKQGGDPAKLAQALLKIAAEEKPPRRFVAGADAVMATEGKLADLQRQIDAFRELSTSLALDEA